MDCSCNCFGIAASSKRPVKRYNLLVPDIFPKQAPPFVEHIDPSTERKLKKLYEYLEKNLHRGPKISRRLARRINTELAAQRLGYVQIAVAAYVFLLQHLREADSTLFAKEVICQLVAKPVHFYSRLVQIDGCASGNAESVSGQDSEDAEQMPISEGQHRSSVVGVLLNDRTAEMRTLGATLLAAFTQQQATTEYLAQIEAFVPLLCQNVGMSTSLASLPGKAPPQAVLALSIACLRALQEQTRLCTRASATARHLETTEICLLDILATETPSGIPQGDKGDAIRALQPGTAGSAESDVSPSARHSLEAAEESRQGVALEVFRDLGRLAQGPAESKRLVEGILSFMDQKRGWAADGQPSASVALRLLQQVCTDEHQQYLAFSALVRHVGAPALAPLQQLSVAQTACRGGSLALPSSMATAALVLAVKELSPLIAQLRQQSHADLVALRTGLLGCIQALARKLEDSQHLLEAVSGIMAKLPGPSPSSTATLECIHAAALSLLSYPAAASSAGLATVPQSLLQELMLVMLRWELQQKLLVHAILQAVLAAGACCPRDKQMHPLLSALWYQLAQQSPPQLFVVLGNTVTALVGSAPLPSLRQCALFAASLQAEAAGKDEGSLGEVTPAQRLAAILLSDWAWACLGRRRGGGMHLQRIQAGLGPVPHLRLGSGGLEQTDSSMEFSTADDAAAAPLLESYRLALGASDRLDALQGALGGWAAEASPFDRHQAAAGELFKPLPTTSLFPKAKIAPQVGDGPGLGGMNPRLRAMFKSRTTEQLETMTASAWTAHDFIAASNAEADRLAAGEQAAVPQAELSLQALAALSAVDALLAPAEGSTHRPRESRDQPGNGVPAPGVSQNAAGQPRGGSEQAPRTNGSSLAGGQHPPLSPEEIGKLPLKASLNLSLDSERRLQNGQITASDA